MVFATVAIFLLSWKMAIIMFVLAPVLMAILGLFSAPTQRATEKDMHNEDINRSIMQEDLSRITLIKAYFMQNKVTSAIRDTYAKKIKSTMKLGVWTGITSASGNLLTMIVFLAILGVGAYFVLMGETTLGNLVAIIQLINYVVTPVSKFSETVAQVSQAIASSKRIGEIYDMPRDMDRSAAESVNAEKVVIKNVSFSYEVKNEDDVTAKVLEDINAKFEKGAVTGIVGKSGSGKSTLLKIIIGLYSPRHGKVELKHSSGVISGEDILTQVAYVPPADYLFSGSVYENIIMSEDKPNKSEIEAAAKSANILEFIQSLPDGFDTLVGESGSTVSSGQAQRISIARALYKKTPIIVFDEPTANLDIDSITKFQSTVRQLAKEKICIIVTHDVSTIDICDTVYVLEDTRLREMIVGEELSFENEGDSHNDDSTTTTTTTIIHGIIGTEIIQIH